MREIKFRAWDHSRGRMIDQPAFQMRHFDIGARYEVRVSDPSGESGAILLKLMQCTGLKDKNGVEMYEGDIAKDAVGRIWVVEYSEVKASFVFSWNKNRKKEQSYFRFNRYQRPLNVIGNIHENPELLESNND